MEDGLGEEAFNDDHAAEEDQTGKHNDSQPHTDGRDEDPNEHLRKTAINNRKHVTVEEVHLDSLVQYLRYSVHKTVVMRHMLTYMLFLVIFTLVELLPMSDPNVNRMASYTMEQLVLEPRAREVSTISEVVDFVEFTVQHLYSAATLQNRKGTTVPIAYIAVRQIRVDPQRCESPSFFPAEEVAFAPQVCFSTDASYDTNEIVAWGDIGKRWRSNVVVNAMGWETYNGKIMNGASSIYRPSKKQYTELFPLSQVASYADPILAEMRRGGFIRRGVRAVFVESLVYNPVVGQFCFAAVLFEVEDSGRVLPTAEISAFPVYSLKTHLFRAIFALEVMFLVCPFFILYTTTRRVRLNRRLTSSWWEAFQPWDIYNYIFFVALIAQLSLDFSIWIIGLTELDDRRHSSDVVFFGDMANYGDLIAIKTQTAAWVLLLAYLRLFYFLQYTFRMSVVSQTVSSAAHEVFGVVLLFAFVLTAYTMAGTYLWGMYTSEFRSFYASFTYLFRVLLSGDTDGYDVFEAYQPASAPLFFASYYFIMWLVLLNIVVGILATSFSSVVDTMMMVRRPEWTPRSIYRDLVSLVRRMRDTISEAYKSVRTMDIRDPDFWGNEGIFIEDRIRLYHRLIMIRDQGVEGTISGPDYITLKKLKKYARFLDEVTVDLIFKKAKLQIGTSDGKVRQLRMTKRAIESGAKMGTQLAKQAVMLEAVHNKVCGLQTGDIIDIFSASSSDVQAIRRDLKDIQVKTRVVNTRLAREATQLGELEDQIKDLYAGSDNVRTMTDLLRRRIANKDPIFRQLQKAQSQTPVAAAPATSLSARGGGGTLPPSGDSGVFNSSIFGSLTQSVALNASVAALPSSQQGTPETSPTAPEGSSPVMHRAPTLGRGDVQTRSSTYKPKKIFFPNVKREAFRKYDASEVLPLEVLLEGTSHDNKGPRRSTATAVDVRSGSSPVDHHGRQTAYSESDYGEEAQSELGSEEEAEMDRRIEEMFGAAYVRKKHSRVVRTERTGGTPTGLVHQPAKGLPPTSPGSSVRRKRLKDVLGDGGDNDRPSAARPVAPTSDDARKRQIQAELEAENEDEQKRHLSPLSYFYNALHVPQEESSPLQRASATRHTSPKRVPHGLPPASPRGSFYRSSPTRGRNNDPRERRRILQQGLPTSTAEERQRQEDNVRRHQPAFAGGGLSRTGSASLSRSSSVASNRRRSPSPRVGSVSPVRRAK